MLLNLVLRAGIMHGPWRVYPYLFWREGGKKRGAFSLHKASGVSSSHISISLNCWILSKLLFLGLQAKKTINKHKKKGAAEETEPMDVERMAQQSMVIILTAQYVHRSITP